MEFKELFGNKIESRIIRIFNEKIAKHKLDVNLEIIQERDSVATYLISTNTIEVGLWNLINNFDILKGNRIVSSIDEFIDIIISHELGHFMDKDVSTIMERQKGLAKEINKAETRNEIRELFKEVTDNQLTLEKNAWDFSLQFTDFQKITMNIREVYTKNDIKNLLNLEQLLLERFDYGRPLKFSIQ